MAATVQILLKANPIYRQECKKEIKERPKLSKRVHLKLSLAGEDIRLGRRHNRKIPVQEP